MHKNKPRQWSSVNVTVWYAWGLFLSYIFFLQVPLYHEKTTFVHSFRQKVVLVASNICLASRRRQKWYLWYLQDILSYVSENYSQNSLATSTIFFPFLSTKNAVLEGFFFDTILRNSTLIMQTISKFCVTIIMI